MVWETGIAEDVAAQGRKHVHCAEVMDLKNGNTHAEVAGKQDKLIVTRINL
jgi:hypothetical protein